MASMNSWHALAAGRGDGLLPEFLALAERQAARKGPTVIELADHAPHLRQAGACPVPPAGDMSGGNIVRLARPAPETLRPARKA